MILRVVVSYIQQMITNVLVGVSVVITLSGIVGIRGKHIGRKMGALTLTTIGSLGIAFSQAGDYGLLSGFQQLIFRAFGLIFFLLLMNSICKKNEITTLQELNGVRRFLPYTYALLVLSAMLLVGIPGTGTFTGIMYAQMGYMYAATGVISYVGMFGNIAGVVITAWLLFPVLREAFLFEKKEEDDKDYVKPVRRKFVRPGKILSVVAGLVITVLLVLGVWQDVTITIVTKLIEVVA